MLLIRVVALLILVAAPALLPAQAGMETVAPPAEATEPVPAPENGFVTFRSSLYHNGDSGDGNPFLDEKLTVIEPVIIFDQQISERFGASAKLTYDYVSSASIDRLSNFPEQSGASADHYVGADVGLRYQLDERWRLGSHAGFSVEYDYTSLSLGGDLTADLADKDARVKLGLNGYFDTIDIIRWDGSQDEGTDQRLSLATTLDYYQVLSASLHGDFGATFALQSGFLETAYNFAVIEDPALPPNPHLDNNARGSEITEELPDSRARTALFGRLRRHLAKGRAVELGARLYGDSWGILSYSLEPRLYQTLIDERLDLRLRYRFYQQTPARYWQRHFTAVERYRTQDSDLGDFSSHSFGFKLTWKISSRTSLDIGADTIRRSDGIDEILTTFGWTLRF